MHTAFLIPLAIFLTANTVRFIYELLKKSGKIDPKSRPLFIFILLVMCALWTSWFAMCPIDPWRVDLPLVVECAGLAILFVGLTLAFGALFQLKGVENINHLVTTGLFARLRHPMYLGFICWIFGWAIYHGALVSLLAGIFGVGNILFWCSLEEEHLAKSFGDKYLAYRRKTWF